MEQGGVGTRVLVVESDPVQRARVADWLGALPGVTVVAVESAGQAMVCERPQSFRLCVLRHELAGVDGLTLGAMIRRLNADARLVLLGSTASPHLVALAREHGFTAVVDHPLSREETVALTDRLTATCPLGFALEAAAAAGAGT